MRVSHNTLLLRFFRIVLFRRLSADLKAFAARSLSRAEFIEEVNRCLEAQVRGK